MKLIFVITLLLVSGQSNAEERVSLQSCEFKLLQVNDELGGNTHYDVTLSTASQMTVRK